MAGYFGTEKQKDLQAKAEARNGFVRTAAGACQTGRTMGCDDPEQFGWDRITEFLDRDGVCGFRLISFEEADVLQSRLEEYGFRLDRWDVLLADRDSALAASEPIVSAGMQNGFRELASPHDPEGQYTAEIQAVMHAAGVVPFSGTMLTGGLGAASTVVIGDSDGAVVAAAHGHLPHNALSRHRHYAWGGLVAVREAERGLGLGRYVNALMIVNVFRDLGATHIYELVSPTNQPSRRMVEACGLRHEPNLVCGLAVAKSTERFTR